MRVVDGKRREGCISIFSTDLKERRFDYKIVQIRLVYGCNYIPKTLPTSSSAQPSGSVMRPQARPTLILFSVCILIYYSEW